MNEPTVDLVTVGALARELGLSRSGVRSLEQRGVIPAALRLEPGNRRVYRRSDLVAIRELYESTPAGGRRQGDRVTVAG